MANTLFHWKYYRSLVSELLFSKFCLIKFNSARRINWNVRVFTEFFILHVSSGKNDPNRNNKTGVIESKLRKIFLIRDKFVRNLLKRVKKFFQTLTPADTERLNMGPIITGFGFGFLLIFQAVAGQYFLILLVSGQTFFCYL